MFTDAVRHLSIRLTQIPPPTDRTDSARLFVLGMSEKLSWGQWERLYQGPTSVVAWLSECLSSRKASNAQRRQEETDTRRVRDRKREGERERETCLQPSINHWPTARSI